MVDAVDAVDAVVDAATRAVAVAAMAAVAATTIRCKCKTTTTPRAIVWVAKTIATASSTTFVIRKIRTPSAQR